MKRLNIIFLLLTSICYTNAQIVINEVQQSNISTLEDNFGEYPDWFELYNAGTATVNLAGYTTTDDLLKDDRWEFPSIDLAAGEYLTVYASGNDVIEYLDHWESPVLESDDWQYVLPDENTSTNWREASFDDSSWLTGPGGFGYADEDDATELPDPTSAVFLRKTFTISDTSEIHSAVFHMDYDDGFVAYLNGVEIARSLMTETLPAYDAFASDEHEAEVYDGGDFTTYEIEQDLLQSAILQGTNVLAIQVHNANETSSDLSARPYLSIGLSTSNTYWNDIPSFFTPESNIYNLHTNFSLNNGNEELFLINQGFIEERLTLPFIPSSATYGRITDGNSTFKLLSIPTPSASNDDSPSFEGTISDIPVFSLDAGFYSSTQNVELITDLTDANIRYTLDGSKPNSTSTIYTGAISVSENTVIRAIIDKDNFISQYVETNTYLIGNDELSDLAVISIAVKPEDFFADEDGIYVLGDNAETATPRFGANFWLDIEREIHMEYFDQEETLQLEQDCGVKIFGGWSRAQDMKSLRLIARDEYGDKTFSHQFFPEKNIFDFRQLVLRNSGNDFNRAHYRDALNHEAIKEEGNHDWMAYKPVVVYLNGEYWGIHNLRERMNHHYVEDNHGVDDDDITLIEMAGALESEQGAKRGDYSHWTDFVAFITDNEMNDDNYQTVKDNLDIENFADYMISQSYHNNWDAPHNNCRTWRPVDNSKKWRYLYYDTDFSLNLFNSSTTDIINDELDRLINDDRSANTIILKKLLENSEFKHFFINRYADLMNTSYKSENYKAKADSIVDLLNNDIDRHHDLWGNNRDGWESQNSSVVSFITGRRPFATQFVESQFSLSGNYDLTIKILPEGAGKVKISTIIPKSYPWTGTYFNDCPVTITAIPNDGYEFDHFSADNTFDNNSNSSITYDFNDDEITVHFNSDDDAANIIISEINYNSSDDLDADDWIELRNTGGKTADLSGWVFKDSEDFNEYTIPEGTTLSANGFLVLSRGLEDFNLIHPSVTNVLGEFPFKLSNGGETIRLYDQFDQLQYSVTYSDEAEWSLLADGEGTTLEFQYLTGVDVNDASNWSFGCLGGSPGTDYIPCLCESPELGETKYLCAQTSILETGIENENLAFSWYKDGDLIVSESSNTLTNLSEGNYSVVVSSSSCLTEDQVMVLAAPSDIDLGDDFEYCSSSPVLLESNFGHELATYTWYKDNVNQNVSISSLNIDQQGTYKLEIEVGNCAAVSDEITVSASSITPNHSTTCNTGSHSLSVNGSGNYEWYASETGGSVIGSGNSFDTPNISATTSYFVEDADYFGGEVGPESPDFSDTWGHDNFEDYQLRFSVLQDLYLHYITVFPKSETSSITINLTKDGSETVIETVTVPATGSEQRIFLGWDLEDDDYVMNAIGTDGELTMNNEDTNYPFTFSNWLEITGTYPDWASNSPNNWYFFFYNFEFSNTPNPRTCDRTTVIAYVCNEPDVTISTSKTELETGESTELTVSVDDVYSTLLIDLGLGANPRYISEPGTHTVTYSSRGTYDAIVEISDFNNNVYTQNINLDITACHTSTDVFLTAANENLCEGDVALTATSLTNHNYYWNNDDVQFDSGNELSTVSTSIAGTFIVEIKDALNENLCNTTTNNVEVKTCPVGTKDFLEVGSLEVHPNPVTDILYYELTNTESVQIYDQLGRVVLTEKGNDNINVSHLSEGIYIIELQKDGQRFISKFEKN